MAIPIYEPPVELAIKLNEKMLTSTDAATRRKFEDSDFRKEYLQKAAALEDAESKTREAFQGRGTDTQEATEKKLGEAAESYLAFMNNQAPNVVEKQMPGLVNIL